jgi:catechol 2,3-dioxygenase-like lactoylglutathione lyase family enzyme
MANTFGTDILIQAPDPEKAAAFYVDNLGFEITGEEPQMISLHGKHINLFIERGPALGPVLEVTVDSVEAARLRLVKNGCEVLVLYLERPPDNSVQLHSLKGRF